MTGSPFETTQLSTIVVLDEADADRILRMLYNGTRPKQIHILICLCGQIADLREDPKAWNGWQILPHAKCPTCLAEPQVKQVRALYPSLAYERFLQELEQVLIQTARAGDWKDK